MVVPSSVRGGRGLAFWVIQVAGGGAEDVVVATAGPDEGAIFTGTEDGAIRRISHDGRRGGQVADTGGRPLGIGELADQRLVGCAARRGLLTVDPANGTVESLVAAIDGRAM